MKIVTTLLLTLFWVKSFCQKYDFLKLTNFGETCIKDSLELLTRHFLIFLYKKRCTLKLFMSESSLCEYVMYSSAFQNAPSASVWQRQHLHVHQAQGCGLWGIVGTSKRDHGKLILTEKGDAASQIILLPAPYICHPHFHALPHLSLISECMNPQYSVERLPADIQHQIKSFTLESKGFSLSLHKHESNGGDGLRWMWASSDIPQRFLHPHTVVIYPSAFLLSKSNVILN